LSPLVVGPAVGLIVPGAVVVLGPVSTLRVMGGPVPATGGDGVGRFLRAGTEQQGAGCHQGGSGTAKGDVGIGHGGSWDWTGEDSTFVPHPGASPLWGRPPTSGGWIRRRQIPCT